tara:strand:+ start:51 stop:290 length:240 start_codon:yes stop_codon:yes gene_type:complete
MNKFLEKKIDRLNIKIDYLEELLERVQANKQDDLIRDIKNKIVLDELKILNKERNKLLIKYDSNEGRVNNGRKKTIPNI